MIRVVTDDQIKEALAVLELAGEAGSKTKYDPHFGPLIRATAEVVPFVVRIDDYGYFCSEESRISLHHDGGKIEWKGKWEPCSPYVARTPCRFLPRKTGEEYGYQRRRFVIPDATYIITERFDAIDRVFLCNTNPEFEWQYVLEGLGEYRRLNRLHTPPRNNRRIQFG